MGFLKKLTIMSAASLLALGATQAGAVEGVDELGHIDASVTGVLNITEVSGIKFGNFSVTCAGGAGATCSNNGAQLTLADTGKRTASAPSPDTITPLYGLGSADGVATGTDQETGSQAPGFYTIDAGAEGTGSQHVYISFADANGNIIDTNHPANNAQLTGPTGQHMYVDTFTFSSDTGTTGYLGTQEAADATNTGNYISLNSGTGGAGKATIRVGATLHLNATVAAYAPGQYAGTYNIMVSY